MLQLSNRLMTAVLKTILNVKIDYLFRVVKLILKLYLYRIFHMLIIKS